VLPWVNAPVALDADLEERHWVAFGRLLAAVHATPATALPELPSSDRSHRRLRGAVAELHRDLDEALAPGSATDVVDDLIAFVLDEAPLLRVVVDALLAGADHLHAAGVWSGDGSPHMACHADPHLGNVLAGDDGRVWLLDWDDAVTGPREQDLLFVLDGGVLAFAPVTAAQTDAFFTGYGAVEIDQHALAYHRSIRALEDLVDFALELDDVSLQARDGRRSRTTQEPVWTASRIARWWRPSPGGSSRPSRASTSAPRCRHVLAGTSPICCGTSPRSTASGHRSSTVCSGSLGGRRSRASHGPGAAHVRRRAARRAPRRVDPPVADGALLELVRPRW
jgi:aminoglycoside phosphotransferase (APT) family kinase protein